MALKLKTLRFDRDTSGGAPAAIPVRLNENATVPNIDWRRTGAIVDATSVAYPLTMSTGDVGDLRVTVTFTTSSAPTAAIFVRAIDQGAHLLGDVAATRIAASDIGNDHHLDLDNVALRAAAVGQHTVDWKWEQSADGITGWTEFDRSTHNVFVTVAQPEAPWGRPGVAHTVVPWQEVMQLACTWATGKRDAKTVMEAITAALDGLAGTPAGRTGRVVRYGDLGSLVAEKVFSVALLLLIVNSDRQAPTRLNCRDLNSALAIMATLLGCPLRVIRLRPTSPIPGATIGTNPIKVFGQPAPGIQSFQYHEAATVPGPPIGNRQVFDACVRVDFDTQPQVSPPAQFRLPVGVAIHQTGADLGYRKRLLTPGSQNCVIEEVEDDGIRYPNALPGDGPASGVPDGFIRERRQHFMELMGQIPVSSPQPTMPPNALEAFLTTNAEPEGFPRNVPVGEQQILLSFTPIKPFTADDGRTETSVVQAKSRRQAIELFATLAAEYVGTLELRDFGDFALHDPRSGTVLMLRGPVIAEISGSAASPDEAPSALTEAGRLDEVLNRFFTAPSR
jgi:hypothetical protein